MSSWRNKDDLGLELVGYIYESLRIPDHWAVDIQRGFMWWAEDFAQTVWADTGMFQNAQSFFRIHIETELLRGKGRAQAFELSLAEDMKDATLSCVCFDADRDLYLLHTSAYATNDNVEWLQRLILTATALQVDHAHTIGHELAKKLTATPATSGHPNHGLRDQPDPTLGVVDRYFKPYGAQPSKWIGIAEWKETEWAMERQASGFESDHQTYLRAFFPWPVGEGFIELIVSTQNPHPQLGNGLDIVLRLPIQMPPERCAHTAMELNNLERKEWLRAQLLGSWGFDEGVLQFESFVPNTSFHDGILMNMTLAMSIRANWVAEQFAAWYQAAQADTGG
jgi:hypothetical protein